MQNAFRLYHCKVNRTGVLTVEFLWLTWIHDFFMELYQSSKLQPSSRVRCHNSDIGE